ncbi:hypothetical protein LQW54_009530 [Pestalotiopsis sp. IQ-011]
MSRFDDRGRPRYDNSPDYAYAGGSGVPPPIGSHARLEYEPQTPFYPPPPGEHLQIPDARARPRSLPPPAKYYGGGRRSSRERDRDRNWDDRDRNHRPHTPIGKAKRAIEDTFTDSTTGLGVGVLGALVGGLAVHEATDHGAKRPSDAQKRKQLLGTMIGAAVGALGANAVEKRLENGRQKTEEKQERWEQKWGRRGHDHDWDNHHGDRGDQGGQRDSYYNDRSGPGRRGSSRGRRREVDPDARSWNNVEDWVYDTPPGDRSRDRRGRRSEEGYRY